MKNKFRMFLTIASAIGFAAVAQNATAAAPVIQKAEATYSTNTITITGSDLSSPSVTLKGVALAVTSATSTVVTAALPAGIGPGSYHLVVSTSGGMTSLDVTLTLPTIVAYDANGQFLGFPLGGLRQRSSTITHSTDSSYQPTIFVPSHDLLVQFSPVGRVVWIPQLSYTSSDCTGTPYSSNSVVQGQVAFRYKGGLVTITTAGPPPPNDTIYHSLYYQGVCKAEDSRPFNLVPVTLTPVTVPFSLPVATPLKIVAQ